MRIRHLAGGAAVAVAALAFGSPAVAHVTPAAGYDAVLKEQHHNVLATSAAFGKECGEFGGSVAAGKEGWVFNVPGGQWSQGTGLKIVFTNLAEADVTVLIKTDSPDKDAYPQGFGPAANPHNAWVQVPAGWKLKDGDGNTVAEQTEFLVTHTCLATSTGTPSPDPTPDPSEEPDPSASVTPTPGGDLPKTGFPVAGFVVTGMVLLAGGAALMMVRRRRDLPEEV